MGSIVVAIIAGVITLVSLIMFNSKSRAITECKIYALAAKVEKHNQLIERTYEFERGLALLLNGVSSLTFSITECSETQE